MKESFGNTKKRYLGVYDGHGGSACADYLRDNLHKFIIEDQNFPELPEKAIMSGFKKAENYFLKYSLQGNQIEVSGSCANVLMIIDDVAYLANLGDSRAIMSSNEGKDITELSTDHKPDDSRERTRIIAAGGKIYKSPNQDVSAIYPEMFKDRYLVQGPWRILPGKLSVARSMGDICAKLPRFGGNPNVLIAVPEIRKFCISKEIDFIVLGCDGIFDTIETKNLMNFAWSKIHQKVDKNIHNLSARLTNDILLESMRRRTLDNITLIFVGFNNLEQLVQRRKNKRDLSENLVLGKASNLIFRTAPEKNKAAYD